MVKDEIKTVIGDFVTLIKDKFGSDNENKEFLSDFADVITGRLEKVLEKRTQTSLYKKKNEEYSRIYNKLSEKLSKEEIEEFEHILYGINDIDLVYIYMLGITDASIL